MVPWIQKHIQLIVPPMFTHIMISFCLRLQWYQSVSTVTWWTWWASVLCDLCLFPSLSVSKDAFAKGEVFLGNKDHGYNVYPGLPASAYCNGAWQHGITIETPDRCFLFTCETESDQQDWLKHFTDVMSATMSPQEYTSENEEHFNGH